MDKQQHIKIFIADDHPVIAHGVMCMLSGHSNISIVGSATSGTDMARLLPTARPTVLLLDLNMPGPDFYENIAWAKREVPWVKIVVFSGYYNQDLVKTLLHAGAKGYVAKESSPEVLTEAILTVVDGGTYIAPPPHALQEVVCQPSSHPELPDDFRKRLSLSRREQEILGLISKGLSSQGIGKTLYISKHTVETHRKNILRKLDFNTSTELVKFAVQQGLV